jgi:hypothetical protein
MKLISKRDFLQGFAPRRIVLDARYSPPQTLVFEGQVELHRSWQMPERVKDIPRWIMALVDALHPENQLFIFPRAGAWGSGNTLHLFQMAAIFASCGVKPSGDEVIQADEAERDAVESLVFLALVHRGTVSDDIFLIPDHGRAILYVDHHVALHVEFADAEFMDQFLAAAPECS